MVGGSAAQVSMSGYLGESSVRTAHVGELTDADMTRSTAREQLHAGSMPDVAQDRACMYQDMQCYWLLQVHL
jgi:hypothetical protein